jgi:hypothetical protein
MSHSREPVDILTQAGFTDAYIQLITKKIGHKKQAILEPAPILETLRKCMERLAKIKTFPLEESFIQDIMKILFSSPSTAYSYGAANLDVFITVYPMLSSKFSHKRLVQMARLQTGHALLRLLAENHFYTHLNKIGINENLVKNTCWRSSSYSNLKILLNHLKNDAELPYIKKIPTADLIGMMKESCGGKIFEDTLKSMKEQRLSEEPWNLPTFIPELDTKNKNPAASSYNLPTTAAFPRSSSQASLIVLSDNNSLWRSPPQNPVSSKRKNAFGESDLEPPKKMITAETSTGINEEDAMALETKSQTKDRAGYEKIYEFLVYDLGFTEAQFEKIEAHPYKMQLLDLIFTNLGRDSDELRVGYESNPDEILRIIYSSDNGGWNLNAFFKYYNQVIQGRSHEDIVAIACSDNGYKELASLAQAHRPSGPSGSR